MTRVPRWEHFPHEADVGVRGIAASMDAAFEQAALALTAVIAEPDSIAAVEEIGLQCQAPDAELLLVDWLNAIVYEVATRRMLFGRFRVRTRGGQLEGRAWGEAIDPARHHPAVEVKGATYTCLRVGTDADGNWVAQCVVDV